MLARFLIRALRRAPTRILRRPTLPTAQLLRPVVCSFSTGSPIGDKKHTETKQFKAETKKLLNIVAKSLYTDKEVFLRELLSNSSDALEKQRFKDLADQTLQISVSVSDTKKQVIIEDNGIGMSKEELIDNLGTIAKSGSKEFVEAIQKEGGATAENIIGQFGVGFYSSFIVADFVEVISKTANSPVAYVWTSDGSGTYQIGETSDPGFQRGTRIVLHLKNDCDKFWQVQEIRTIVQKYSNFINYPITINGERLNLVKAIWSRDKREITEEQYLEFYQFLTDRSQSKYFSKLHYSADVPISIKALLYIPNSNTERFGIEQEKSQLSLYSRRVLIKKNCRELIPNYLRFVKGVVDCEDIPLNISRENYQDSALMSKLRSVITKRILKHLREESEKDPEAYSKWFNEFQLMIKEGLLEYDSRTEVMELNRFECSTKEGIIDLKTYLTLMKEKQDKIFYMFSAGKHISKRSPHLEPYNKAGLPVIMLNVHIDEIVFREIGTYKDFKFANIETDEEDLSKYLEEVKHDESKGIKSEDLTTFPLWIKNQLQPFVAKVVVSRRNISGPALVASPISASLRQMQMMRQIMEKGDANQETDMSNLTFEINPNHKLMAQLNELRKWNPKLATMVVRQIFDNCCIDGNIEMARKDTTQRVNQLLELLMEKEQDSSDQPKAERK